MTDPEPGPDEALTKEEIQGNEEAPPVSSKKNAFTELMSPKRKRAAEQKPTVAASTALASSRGGNPFKDRMGLGAYLAEPTSFPSSRVIQHNDDFVVIHDKFPKASIHTLLLPRSAKINLLHPFDALEDPQFLTQVKGEVAQLKKLVAKELQRQFGPGSKLDAAREAVLSGQTYAATTAAAAAEAEDNSDGKLPERRDWSKEVICGVHAVPSMGHVHIHVLSRDMHSSALRHRKHYNSFTTPFLVNIDDFPLAADDPRRRTKDVGYLNWNMKCWRCGEEFGHAFAKLKRHLEEEFLAWKAE